MNPQRELYTIQKNDTLWKIARDHSTTVDELQKLNGIKNPRAIHEGQQIALDKEAVGGFRVLFLDLDRNPIPNLSYRLQTNGKTYTGKSAASGETKRIVTDSPFDLVFIWAQRIDKTWKKLRTVMSGFGDKQAVMVSGHMAIPAKTEKHPDLPPGSKPDSRERPKPKHAPTKPPSPTTDKKDFGPKTTQTKTPDGKPLTVVEGDIPDLSYLGEYVGGEVSNEEIKAAAQELKCEPGLIYAIARQESAHSSFIKLGKRTVPSILFERHQFSKYSHHQYDEKYRDISSKEAYHKTARKKKIIKGKDGGKDKVIYEVIDVKTGKTPVESDIYGPPGVYQYKRLAKAYQLDREAALKACSWGKFQIMGFNCEIAGYKDVFSFVKGMSTGDPAHINAFLKFAKSNKTLLTGLREKDFVKIAAGHNGSDWQSVNPLYASNLEKFYKEYELQNKNT
jgi:murein DD-endopeptidase MepM/ murein hydrolase activator NlpD